MARILNLDAAPSTYGPTVRIDGHDYPFLTTTMLPPLQAREFLMSTRRIDELVAKPEGLTKSEQKELEELPAKMVALVVSAPADVLKKLTPTQRTRIISTFLGRDEAPEPPAAGVTSQLEQLAQRGA